MERLESGFIELLKVDLVTISNDGEKHFESIQHITSDVEGKIPPWERPHELWLLATDQERESALALRKRLTDFGTRLIQTAGTAVLLEPTDATELRRKLRQMYSALFLRKFVYTESYVISQEDQFYGIQPASQDEEFITVEASKILFAQAVREIANTMELIAPTPEKLAAAIVWPQPPGVLKTRRNTAFIIMQINEGIPKLEDIKNTIKATFREFGIDAVRSDEIEHSGVITQRILDEIATSEFLIADLTGERPSVYYEVGYAHALGKRPILYREKGAPLHFDLLVHNVPEYKNATELSKMLRERLKAVTGREAKSAAAS